MRSIYAALGAMILAVPSLAPAGPYVGLGIGGARTASSLTKLNLFPALQVPGPVPPGGLITEYDGGENFSSSGVTFDVAAGWTFGRYIGVEVGYADFGKATQLYRLPDACDNRGCQSREWTAQAKLAGYRAFLIGTLPLAEHVEAYAKVGAIYWDGNYDGFERNAAFTPGPPIAPRNEPVTFKDDGTDLAAGIGLNLKLDAPVSLRVDFTYYDMDTVDFVWTAGLTALYHF
ncbi:MAG: outer membrane beta-barrel protein [Gammaproteobacteria bacterium]